MSVIRPPAVAGLFYPSDSAECQAAVDHYLASAKPRSQVDRPLALVVPHAGYQYSAPIAAEAFKLLASVRDKIRRVILLGPNHRVPLRGIAASGASAFATPMGEVPVDQLAISSLEAEESVHILDLPHVQEHCLEVQLPFLQTVLSDFTVVPLVVGEASREEIAGVLRNYVDDENTLIVVSTDLSHYHDYQTARVVDAETDQLICSKQSVIVGEQACGCHALNGLLLLASERELNVEQVALSNSGDTAGSRDSVVGYGAYVIY